MNFYYVNSRNERIDLSDYPYLFQSGNLLDYSWSYEASNNRIRNVKKEAAERNFSVALLPAFSGTKEERQQELLNAANRIFEVFEYDVINNVNGRLFTDTGCFLPCRIISSEKSNWRLGIPFQQQKFTVISDVNYWIQEKMREFLPSAQSNEAGGLDFTFDYPFDYTSGKTGLSYWNIGHYDSCDFKMKIYGPCEDPVIYINGHKYAVNCSLEAGSYLSINSLEGTIIKTAPNSDVISLFNNRNKESNIFEPLPSKPLTLSWNGLFGFDLTAFVKRSEPSWN